VILVFTTLFFHSPKATFYNWKTVNSLSAATPQPEGK